MGKLRESLEDLHMNGQVGDWCLCDTNQGMIMFLRYPVSDENWTKFYLEAPELNRGDIVSLHLSGDKQPVWQWDGNREAPTLSPSINVVGRWHGFLRAGQIITV